MCEPISTCVSSSLYATATATGDTLCYYHHSRQLAWVPHAEETGELTRLVVRVDHAHHRAWGVNAAERVSNEKLHHVDSGKLPRFFQVLERGLERQSAFDVLRTFADPDEDLVVGVENDHVVCGKRVSDGKV